MSSEVVPIVDAQRFELTANILRPGLAALLHASDTAGPDKAALIQAAAVLDWIIAQCERTAITYRGLEPETAAILAGEPMPDQPEAAAAKVEMALEKRPALPANLTAWHQDLDTVRTALDQAEQILSWSRSDGARGATERINELQRWVT